MSFAGKVWRLLVGIKDALALVFLLLFFTALFTVLAQRPSPGLVRDGALLLDLDGSIVEEPAAINPVDVLISGTLPTAQYAARDIVRAIDEAAGDKRIRAIALDLTTFTGGGQVHMEEITEALDRFRQTDKPVLAYAVAYSDDSVMLAAHASEVWVDPIGGAAILGPGGYRLYYAEALQRYGVDAHVYRVGTFKSAVEPYTQSSMSDPARENAEQYTSALWDEYRANVMQARAQVDFDRATTDLPALIAENGGDFAKAAVAAGLADTIGTHEEWGKRVAELAGEDDWDSSPGAFANTPLDVWLADIDPDGPTRALGSSKKKVGVITIAGEISDGMAGPGEAGAARIAGLLDDALDDDLAALVVRVDSPGGTVTGSETIRRAIMRHKDKGIPIAVSMGNYAASGGYWISTPAQRIFAQPETLTGSIGVFLVVPSFEKLLAEYGVHSDGVQTTPLSGQPDLFAGFTPEAEALLQAETSSTYDRFLGLVSESRGLTRERADELAQGRVWTGGTARQLGLVDQFGDLDAALEWAAKQAGLEDGEWEPDYLASAPDPYAAMLDGILGTGAETRAPASISAILADRQEALGERVLADIENLFSARGVQARCLDCGAPAPVRPRAAGTWWQALAARTLAN
jgi:protease-4